MADHRARKHIQRARFQVDHRRGSDAKLRLDEGTLHVSCGNGRITSLSIKKTDVPQRWIVRSIRIERVHAVVLGGDKERVILSLSGNLQRWDEQRLGVYRAVNFERAQLAELFYVDACWI